MFIKNHKSNSKFTSVSDDLKLNYDLKKTGILKLTVSKVILASKTNIDALIALRPKDALVMVLASKLAQADEATIDFFRSPANVTELWHKLYSELVKHKKGLALPLLRQGDLITINDVELVLNMHLTTIFNALSSSGYSFSSEFADVIKSLFILGLYDQKLLTLEHYSRISVEVKEIFDRNYLPNFADLVFEKYRWEVFDYIKGLLDASSDSLVTDSQNLIEQLFLESLDDEKGANSKDNAVYLNTLIVKLTDKVTKLANYIAEKTLFYTYLSKIVALVRYTIEKDSIAAKSTVAQAAIIRANYEHFSNQTKSDLQELSTTYNYVLMAYTELSDLEYIADITSLLGQTDKWDREIERQINLWCETLRSNRSMFKWTDIEQAISHLQVTPIASKIDKTTNDAVLIEGIITSYGYSKEYACKTIKQISAVGAASSNSGSYLRTKPQVKEGKLANFVDALTLTSVNFARDGLIRRLSGWKSSDFGSRELVLVNVSDLELVLLTLYYAGHIILDIREFASQSMGSGLYGIKDSETASTIDRCYLIDQESRGYTQLKSSYTQYADCRDIKSTKYNPVMYSNSVVNIISACAVKKEATEPIIIVDDLLPDVAVAFDQNSYMKYISNKLELKPGIKYTFDFSYERLGAQDLSYNVKLSDILGVSCQLGMAHLVSFHSYLDYISELIKAYDILSYIKLQEKSMLWHYTETSFKASDLAKHISNVDKTAYNAVVSGRAYSKTNHIFQICAGTYNLSELWDAINRLSVGNYDELLNDTPTSLKFSMAYNKLTIEKIQATNAYIELMPLAVFQGIRSEDFSYLAVGQRTFVETAINYAREVESVYLKEAVLNSQFMCDYAERVFTNVKTGSSLKNTTWFNYTLWNNVDQEEFKYFFSNFKTVLLLDLIGWVHYKNLYYYKLRNKVGDQVLRTLINVNPIANILGRVSLDQTRILFRRLANFDLYQDRQLKYERVYTMGDQKQRISSETLAKIFALLDSLVHDVNIVSSGIEQTPTYHQEKFKETAAKYTNEIAKTNPQLVDMIEKYISKATI